jgi:hypothetical protein
MTSPDFATMTPEEIVKWLTKNHSDWQASKRAARSSKSLEEKYPIDQYPYILKTGSGKHMRRFIDKARAEVCEKRGIPVAKRDTPPRPVQHNNTCLIATFNTDSWRDEHRDPTEEELMKYFPDKLSVDKAEKVSDAFDGLFFIGLT